MSPELEDEMEVVEKVDQNAEEEEGFDQSPATGRHSRNLSFLRWSD